MENTNKIIGYTENQLLLFGESLPLISKCTVQLFVKYDQILPCATSILFEYYGRWFLFSAAHVFENIPSDLYIKTSPHQFYSLGGNAIKNISENREKDLLDYCVFELNDLSKDHLKINYIPIDFRYIEAMHKPINNLHYFVYGFPVTMSKFKRLHKRGKSTIEAFKFGTMPANQDEYNKLNCSKTDNLIFKYEKNKCYDYKKKEFYTGPDTYGISGGGVWCIESNYQHNKITARIKLVSILTTWPSANRNVWISTRIDIFLKTLKYEFGCNIRI